jgi:hypothetical protein
MPSATRAARCGRARNPRAAAQRDDAIGRGAAEGRRRGAK